MLETEAKTDTKQLLSRSSTKIETSNINNYGFLNITEKMQSHIGENIIRDSSTTKLT